MRYLRRNTATTITVGPFFDVTDGITPEVSLTVTGCHLTLMVDNMSSGAGTPTLALDADATASGGDNDMVHITNDDAGYYSLELTAAQTNYLGGAHLTIIDTDVHLPVFHEFTILPAQVYDSMIEAGDLLAVDTREISSDSTAADNCEAMYDGTGYAGGTIKLGVDAVAISGDTTAADNCEAMYDGTGYVGGTIKLGVDAVAISGDATAADNCEAMFDGTGYAGGTIKLGTNVTQWLGTAVGAATAGVPNVNAIAWANAATNSGDIALVDTPANFASLAVDASGGVTIGALNSDGQTAVEAEVEDALQAMNLDHLCKVACASNDDLTAEVVDGTIISNMLSDGDTSAYNPETDALQPLHDNIATTAEIQEAVTGGAYAIDTDANGRVRIVDGTGAGELDTTSGTVKLTDASITTSTFATGAINAAALGADCITSAKIADDAIGPEHIGSAAIVADSFGAGAIANAVLADDAISLAKIANGAISAAKFASAAVTSTVLASDCITNSHISDTAVSEIADAAATAILATPAQKLATDASGYVTLGALKADVITSAGIADDAISAEHLNTGAISADALAADAVAEIAGGVFDEALSGHTTSGTFGQRMQVIRTATAQAGAAGTITLDASASAVANFYNGCMIHIVGGTGVGQVRKISAYDESTKIATVSSNWATNPSSDSVFIIYPLTVESGTGATAQQVWEYTAASRILGAATNITSDGAAINTTAGVVDSVGTVATLTGHTAQTGDSYARLGAPAGASVSADIAAVKSDSAAILTDTGTTIPGVLGSPAGADMSTDIAAIKSETSAILTDTGTTLPGVLGSPAGADLATDIAAIKSETASILSDTNAVLVDTGTTIPGVLGSPAGASMSADIAAVKSDSAAILTDTGTTLPATLGSPAGASMSADIAAVKSDTAATLADTGTDGVKIASGTHTGAVIPTVTTCGTVTTLTNWNVIGVKKSTALNGFTFVMRDSTNHAPQTGLTVSAYRSIDGNAYAPCTNSVSEVSNGTYSINLSAGDLNGTVIMLRFFVTGGGTDDLFVQIKTQSTT